MAEHLFIPDDWKQWIAANLLIGGDAEELIEILANNGFPRQLAKLEVNTASSHPFVDAGRSIAKQKAKSDWFTHNIRILESGAGEQISRRRYVETEEFFAEFYSRNRPVIITGILERWQACSKWNKDYLIEVVGEKEVQIQANRNSNPRYEVTSLKHRKLVSFREFIDSVFEEGKTNDFYMTANNAEFNAAALKQLWDDIDFLPEYLSPDLCAGRSFIWIGPAGTITPLHHDLTNNLMAQVSGRKVIKLISPAQTPFLYNDFHCYSAVDLNNVDLDRFPLFRNVFIQELILEPGELLFLPVGWWHHVEGLDVSVTLTFTGFRWPNEFTDHYKTYGKI